MLLALASQMRAGIYKMAISLLDEYKIVSIEMLLIPFRPLVLEEEEEEEEEGICRALSETQSAF